MGKFLRLVDGHTFGSLSAYIANIATVKIISIMMYNIDIILHVKHA